MKITSKIITTDAKLGYVEVDKYQPLQNLGTSEISDNWFSNIDLDIDLSKEIEMSLVDSYDDSVNIIINGPEIETKIINSGFSKIGDKWTDIELESDNPTNKYSVDNVLSKTKLFLHTNSYPKIHLEDVFDGGELKCGNYIFYFKYCDGDKNTTDIVGESGIVSIFNGDISKISSIKGGIQDEITNKAITFKLTEVDPNYNSILISYKRATSDSSGFKLDKYYQFNDYFLLNRNDKGECLITITGSEPVEEISQENINIQYNYYNHAESHTIVQNRLFLANLSSKKRNINSQLKQCSLNIETSCEISNERSVGYINDKYEDNTSIDDRHKYEYYNPINIYERLGYWPDEFYRFGIVYIFDDGSKSEVFNLKGGWLNTPYENFSKYKLTNNSEHNNELGVFRTPKVSIYSDTSVNPISFNFTIKSDTRKILKECGVVAYVFVRQPRLINTIAQGLSVGVNRNAHVPTPYVYLNEYNNKTNIIEDTPSTRISGAMWGNLYIAESFVPHASETIGYGGETFGNWLMGVDSLIMLKLDNSGTRRIIPLPDGGIGFKNNHIWRNDKETYKRSWDLPNLNNNQSGTIGLWEYESWISSTTYYGLLCTDAYCIPQIQSLLSGQDFYLNCVSKYRNNNNVTLTYSRGDNYISLGKSESLTTNDHIKYQCLYIPENTNKKTIYKSVGDKDVFYKFSTVIGNVGAPYDCTELAIDRTDPQIRQYLDNGHASRQQVSVVRGNFAPFIGLVPDESDIFEFKVTYNNVDHIQCYPRDTKIVPSAIYNIRSYNLNDNNSLKSFIARVKNNEDAYYSVSDYINLDSNSDEHVIFRGDCFTCTTSTRMQWNFVDPEVPLQDDFVDDQTWANHYYRSNGGIEVQKNGEVSKINRGDINAIQLGYWLTYKSLSNYNIGLRSEDKTHMDEMQKLGNFRSFYPARGFNKSSGNCMADSSLFNVGYATTLSNKAYFTGDNVPYQNYNWSTRIAYSLPENKTSFTNEYRTFQGLSYKDFETTYGSITKLESYGNDVFIVFEHGCALLPVNEKALLQTTTDQNIHIYGSDVVSSNLTILSPDYGSTWKNSVIKTPHAIYGVDVSAKKIWQYNANGFIIISDFKIQKLLNDTLNINELFELGISEVRSHYNASKNDVMFTFYSKDVAYNICYNELLSTFTCKYTWMPYISENVDAIMYSVSKKDVEAILKHENKNIEKPSCTIYKHDSSDSNILPTYWYNEQHPFEFECIVSDPVVIQKIFDNLSIISNNVEPESLEISLIGDGYSFKDIDNVSFPTIKVNNKEYKVTESIDTVTKEQLYTIHQPCLNINEYGRRIGNIHYQEDLWKVNIQPITVKIDEVISQTRLRDKWARIRIKYSGNKLAIITALLTSVRISYV